jgi:hypothetical protein
MAVENSVVAPVRSARNSGESVQRLCDPGANRHAAPAPLPRTVQPTEPACSERRRNLQACIAWLLESGSGDHVPVEKRAHRRFPFRKPITVTPVNNHSGRPDRLKSFSAFGIDISTCGICFLARHLVPARKAVLSAEGPSGELVTLLFEPRWVRFTRGGWYQTGGRLVEVLPEEKEPFLAVRLVDAPPELDELCENSRHSHLKPL